MLTKINGKTKRAYLEVYFEEAHSEALSKAKEITKILEMPTDEDSDDSIECDGLMLEYSEDFRSMIGDFHGKESL